MADERNDPSDSDAESGRLPTSRRGMLAAGVVGVGVGSGLTALATDGGRGGDRSLGGEPDGGDRSHDHGGDALGESEPVESVTAGSVEAAEFEAADVAAESLDVDRVDTGVLTAGHLSVEGTNRVDVVGESAIDHEGDLSAEIQAYLAERDETNHLFVLPAGTYSWNTQFDEAVFDFLGVVGAPHAALKIESHDPDYAFDVGSVSGLGEGIAGDQAGRHLLLKNLTVDITESDRHDAGVVHARIARRALIENVRLEGRRNYVQSEGGGKFCCRVDTVDEEGYSVIRNVRMLDGEVPYPGEGTAIPIAADPPHVGTNVWEGCVLQGWTSGFYVMNNRGRNVIQGCLTVNCNNFGIRLGRNDVCRDSRIVLSDASDREVPGTGLNIAGGSPVVENVRIEAPDAWNRCIFVLMEAEGGTIRDVDVHIGEDSPVPAIDAQGNASLRDRLRFENVTIVDENDGSAHPVHGGGREYVVDNLPHDTIFRDCRIETPRSGIAVRGRDPLDDVHVENCRIETGGDALRFFEPGGGHTVVNNRFEGDVGWDAPLSEVLWTGNRHDGAVDAGDAEDWRVANNWGFDEDA